MGMEDDFLLEDEDDENHRVHKELFASGHERGFLGR